MASQDNAWSLKGAREAASGDSDGTVMILDTRRTKSMCSRHVFYYMEHGFSDGQVELLPDSSTFSFTNGQQALASEKCRIWFSYDPVWFIDFSIMDEDKVPFVMSFR